MEGQKEMALYRMGRANEAIEEAQVLLDAHRHNAAINRLYYSCFFAVSALLLTKDISVKRHSAAIQMFGLHFVGPGLISKESGRFYSQMLELRQESDYEYFIEFDAQEVLDLVPQVEALITEIRNLLFVSGTIKADNS